MYCLDYLIAYGGGVITVDAGAATNCLTRSEPARYHYKLYDLLAKKSISNSMLKNHSLENGVCGLYVCLDPIFLVAFLEVLFN